MLTDFFILTKTGNIIYTYHHNDNSGEDTHDALFSGFVSALMSFFAEIRSGMIKKFSTDKYTIHAYASEKFYFIYQLENPNTIADENVEQLNNQLLDLLGQYPKTYDDYVGIPEEIMDAMQQVLPLIISEWAQNNKEDKFAQKLKEVFW